jgi:hypothetical protein
MSPGGGGRGPAHHTSPYDVGHIFAPWLARAYEAARSVGRGGMCRTAVDERVTTAPMVRVVIGAIIDLKREYAALNTHEITTICWARFGQGSG